MPSELGRLILPSRSSAPGSPVEGEVWWDNVEKCVKIYDNADWQRLLVAAAWQQMLPAYYYSNMQQQGVAAALTLNRLTVGPIYLNRRVTLVRIGVYVTAGGSAGSVVRLGAYKDDDGKPDALLFDAGTVATTTSSAVAEITISQAVGPGVVWLACVAQVAVPTVHQVSGMTPAVGYPSGQVSTLSQTGYYQGSISGALPSPWGATLDLANVARVHVRTA